MIPTWIQASLEAEQPQAFARVSGHAIWAPAGLALLGTLVAVLAIDVNGLTLLPLLFAGGPLLNLGWELVKFRRTAIASTPERIVLITNAFGVTKRAIRRTFVSRIVVTQGPIQRLLDLCTISIDTAGLTLSGAEEEDGARGRLRVAGIRIDSVPPLIGTTAQPSSQGARA